MVKYLMLGKCAGRAEVKTKGRERKFLYMEMRSLFKVNKTLSHPAHYYSSSRYLTSSGEVQDPIRGMR